MDNLHQNILREQLQVPFDTVPHDLFEIKPTASELGHLWSSYLAENMSNTILKHMIAQCKDTELRNVLQLAFIVSDQNLKEIEKIYNAIGHPIPIGFDDKDVNVNAPSLFDDVFSVQYTRLMTKYVLVNYSISFCDSTRTDIRELFSHFINKSKEVIEKADEVLLAKGVFPKPPYIPIPDRAEFVHNKSYLGSFLGRSERPLNAIEINHLFNIMEYKTHMKSLKQGFAQVMQSEKFRDHLNRGLKMADKQLDILRSFLETDGLHGPESSQFRVSDSTEAPFSERLMMFHVTTALGFIVTAYGHALTTIARKDVALGVSRLLVEVLEYIEDGVELLIENGWLEKGPEAANRRELIH